MRFSKTAALAGMAGLASAQTYTSCNPTTNSSCPSDTGLNKASYSVDFTAGESSDWTLSSSSASYSSSTGAALTITESGNAPTLISNFYIFFGRVSVLMRASPGTGIVSSIVLESDDLDEIDWEWIGGEDDQVQTDYFGKGNTTAYDRGTVDNLSSGTQSTFRNYTLVWTETQTEWYIDGSLLRTLTYAEALNGKNYPQTPMQIKVGSWAGGDSSNAEGTIEWAGGETDYSDGPFTMYVKSIEIENYNPGSSYTYGDETGDYSSIVVSDASSDDSSSSSAATTATTATTKTKTTSTSTVAKSTATSGTTGSSTDSSSSSSNTTSSSNGTSTTTTSSSASATVNVSGASTLGKASVWAVSALLAVAAFNL
ncbi:transglycosylase [Sporothrix eucalyptigena]|uniref:Crh-like protein n=1 Tax=Sporothrix eucalyptigena TaxID=1812306 RepID=A0ABP0CMN7_9PEZI